MVFSNQGKNKAESAKYGNKISGTNIYGNKIGQKFGERLVRKFERYE